MQLTSAQKKVLLVTARTVIEHGLSEKKPLAVIPDGHEPALRAPGASFVTLTIGKDLRGCIGGLEAIQPLIVDVAQHAYAAAFQDPRFLPLSAEEVPQLALHISVLSPSMTISFKSEDALAAMLRPGVDGLIVAHGKLRATFLPAVWKSIPDRHEFIKYLKRKAGLPDTVLDYQAWRYTATEFSSTEET